MRKPSNRRARLAPHLGLLSIALAATACSGRDTTSIDEAATAPSDPAPSDPAPNDPSPSDPASGAEEPRYVVSPWIFTNDDSTTYVALVPSLEEGDVDLANALEYPGGADVFGPALTGSFYIAPYTSPTVERWRVTEAGAFEKLGTISFANLGIGGAGTRQVFSRGKAYFVAEGEMVIWDPEAMELIGTVPIPYDYQGEGLFDPNIGLTALRDDLLVVYGHWSDVDDWMRWADHATQVTFDTRSDTVVSIFDESRCEMLEPFGRQTRDGKTYFSSDPAYQLLERAHGEEYGTRSCGMRVLDADGTFDPDFFVDVSTLVDGRPAGLVTPVSDDVAFVDVFHTELFGDDITPENQDAASASPSYRFWLWRPGEAAAEDSIVQIPRTSASAWQNIVDGKVYVQDHDADYSVWTLLELRPDGTVHRGLSSAGYASTGIVRVR